MRERGDGEGQVDDDPVAVLAVDPLQKVECGVARSAALTAGVDVRLGQVVDIPPELREGVGGLGVDTEIHGHVTQRSITRHKVTT